MCRVAAGCVSYVDGTKDRKNFPIDGGWQEVKCKMDLPQMFNFASRCEKQLTIIGVDSPAKLAPQINDRDRDTRARTIAAFRNLQVLFVRMFVTFCHFRNAAICRLARPRPRGVH